MSSHHQNSGNVFGILEAIRDQFKVEKLLLILVMGCKVFTTTSASLTYIGLNSYKGVQNYAISHLHDILFILRFGVSSLASVSSFIRSAVSTT